MALPKSIQLTCAALEPCATSLALPESTAGTFGAAAIAKITTAARDHDILAVGPGLDISPTLSKLLGAVIALKNKPVVVDADGLNNLCKIKNWPKKAWAQLVLTPHPGEAKRLWASLKKSAWPKKRPDAALALAKSCGQIVVLKGAGTVVTDGARVYVNKTGNPGMATGGTGDVLTGVIAGLIGQDLDPFEAAVLGVYLHGRAGDLAAEMTGQVSLTASDLLDVLPDAYRYPRANPGYFLSRP
jgi:NAD(P)H-hydrate epimerase